LTWQHSIRRGATLFTITPEAQEKRKNMNIKKIIMIVGVYVGLLTLMIQQVAAVTFEEWLPFELSWTSLVWFLIVLLITMAGGTAGIAAKHYQSKNWAFAPEDLVYYAMVASISVLFFVTQIPAEQCFLYGFSVNGGLGILRNLVTDRQGKTP
jgi:hypothetical protein